MIMGNALSDKSMTDEYLTEANLEEVKLKKSIERLIIEDLQDIPYSLSRLTKFLEKKLSTDNIDDDYCITSDYVKKKLLEKAKLVCNVWNNICKLLQANPTHQKINVKYMKALDIRINKVHEEVLTYWNTGITLESLPIYTDNDDAYKYALINSSKEDSTTYKIEELPVCPCEIKEFTDQLKGNHSKAARTLLLYGVSGTGKTTIANSIAKTINATILNPTAASLISKYHGDTHKNIDKLFEGSKELSLRNNNKWVVIFLDEVDSFLNDRTHADGEDNRIVNTLLLRIDYLNKFPGNTVLVGATNHSQRLDNAALQRFVTRVEVKLPSYKNLVEYIIFYIRREDEKILSVKEIEECRQYAQSLDEHILPSNRVKEIEKCRKYAQGLDGRSIYNAVKKTCIKGKFEVEELRKQLIIAQNVITDKAAKEFYKNNGFEVELRYENFEACFASNSASKLFIATSNHWVLSFEGKFEDNSYKGKGGIVLEMLDDEFVDSNIKNGFTIELEYYVTTVSKNYSLDSCKHSILSKYILCIPGNKVYISWEDIGQENYNPRTRAFREAYIDKRGTFTCCLIAKY